MPTPYIAYKKLVAMQIARSTVVCPCELNITCNTISHCTAGATKKSTRSGLDEGEDESPPGGTATEGEFVGGVSVSNN